MPLKLRIDVLMETLFFRPENTVRPALILNEWAKHFITPLLRPNSSTDRRKGQDRNQFNA